MNLPDQFRQRLSTLGTSGATVLSVTSDSRQLVCDVYEANSLAVLFDQLTLRTTELADQTVAQLERLSESLSGRLTYLLEPIAPIEADTDQCVVQMRSNPPQRDDDGRSYYELLVRRGGEIMLCRYRKENGSARQRVPANVTREVLLRLADDFSAVLD